MSKVTKFVFICVLSVIGVRNSHGSSYRKLNLQGRVMATAFTPFDKNGNLDVSLIPKIAQYYSTNNIRVVYISAFYGGGPSLNLEERKALALAWDKQANRLGLDLIVEIGAAPFVEVLAYAQFCSQLNVTALTAFPEIVYQPKVPSEMVQDIQKICDASCDIPLFHHEIVIAGQLVDAVQTYLSACNRVSCFAGVISSIDKLTTLRASTDSTDCQFWVETSDQTGPGLLLQMDAVTSPATNLCPGLVLDIADAAKANDVKRVLKLQQQCNNIVSAITNFDGGVLRLSSRTSFENLKAAFYVKSGINTGFRYPIEKPNSTFYDQIRSNFADLNCY